MESRTYGPGKIIIREGETSRDLFFLTDGVVEISAQEESGNFILSEIEAPDMFGEISFLEGSPRAATAKAKTKVDVLVFKYEILKDQITKLPPWFKQILSTLLNRIKLLDKRIIELEEEILELKKN